MTEKTPHKPPKLVDIRKGEISKMAAIHGAFDPARVASSVMYSIQSGALSIAEAFASLKRAAPGVYFPPDVPAPSVNLNVTCTLHDQRANRLAGRKRKKQ